MKEIFEIKNKIIIEKMLDEQEYGTLAICANNKPYSLPINYVRMGENIYFHGSKKGRKIDILKSNCLASFSVVEAYSLIASYMSSKENLACPATQFFKSIIIDGHIEFVDDYVEKTRVLESLMQKLQKEGKYKPLDASVYKKAINATTVYKLVPRELKAKFKFGQHLTQERFNMILGHLRKRGIQKDIQTLKIMQELRDDL